MRYKSLLLLSFVVLFLGIATNVARAEDSLKVAFQPGQKIAKHSHPDHYVYVVEGGMLKISKPDGSASDVNLSAGQVVWIPAETHWAENTGTSKVRLVVNELKGPRPTSKKK